MLKRRPPPPLPPFFLSLPLLPLGPGVFLEVNEKRNLNCLPLKGMSGSAGWKLVLLMSLTFSMWVGHVWSQVCVRLVLCTAQECCGLGDSRRRRVGYWAGLRIQERRGVRGIFGIFQEPFQSGSRCILLPRDLARAARQTVIKGEEERWTSRSTSYQSCDAGVGRWHRIIRSLLWLSQSQKAAMSGGRKSWKYLVVPPTYWHRCLIPSIKS